MIPNKNGKSSLRPPAEPVFLRSRKNRLHPDLPRGIVALRESVIALARVLFWRRWSVTVAILCFVIFVVILTLDRCTDSKAPLIETPDLQPPTP